MSVAIEPEQLIWPEMGDLLPCEWMPHPCDRPAEWVMWRACCVDRLKYALYCTDHKDDILTDDEPGMYCVFCGTAYVPATLLFTRIEPLNGASGG